MKSRLAYLKSCNEMNAALVKRIDQLIKASKSNTISNDVQKAVSLACEGFKDVRPAGEDGEEGPAYADMIESLIVQIYQQIEGKGDSETSTVEELNKHREQLLKALDLETKEYNDLLEERSRHILSEDIHTGFDSTLINKEAKKESKESIEVINSPSTSASASTSAGASTGASAAAPSTSTSTDASDDVKASADAIEYSKLPAENIPALYSFLDKHPHIIKESEKDALMMLAFEQQLSKDPKEKSRMRNTVHNALLLQYCATIGAQGMRVFFARIADKNHPALEAFKKDVDFTCNHIKQRCELLSKEPAEEGGEQEGVEQIQLHAVDPDTEIVVSVPEPDSPGRLIYDTFNQTLRTAIESRKLDEINKVLGEMTIEEAEKVVEELNSSGVLTVEEKIYDVEEWEAAKERLQNEQAFQELERKAFGETTTTEPQQPFADTNDELD